VGCLLPAGQSTTDESTEEGSEVAFTTRLTWVGYLFESVQQCVMVVLAHRVQSSLC